MIVERRILTEGWKSVNFAAFADMDRPVRTKEKSVVISYRPEAKVRCLHYHSVVCRSVGVRVIYCVRLAHIIVFNSNTHETS